MARKHKPIHPGEILSAEFLEPLGLSQYRLAKETGMPADRIARLVKGTRGFSADTALRLARFFGTTPEFWLELQSRFDIETAMAKHGRAIEKRVNPHDSSRRGEGRK